MNSSSPLFKVVGTVACSYDYTTNVYTLGTAVRDISIGASFPNLDAAKAFAGQFPKSYGLRCYTLYSSLSAASPSTGVVELRATLAADGVNGGRNETGVARARKFLAKVPYEFKQIEKIQNPATVEQLKALLA